MNPEDQWSGEAKRPAEKDHYLTTEELDRRKLIIGRLVRTEEGWFLESLEPVTVRVTVAHERPAKAP